MAGPIGRTDESQAGAGDPWESALMPIVMQQWRAGREADQQQVDQWATHTMEGVINELTNGNAGGALNKLNTEALELHKQLGGPNYLYQEYRLEVEDRLKTQGFISDLAVAYAEQNFEELDGNWRGEYSRRADFIDPYYRSGAIDLTEVRTAENHYDNDSNTPEEWLKIIGTDPFGDVFAHELGNAFDEIRLSDKETVDKIPIIGLGGHEREAITRDDLTKYLHNLQNERTDATSNPGTRLKMHQLEAAQAFLGDNSIFDLLDDKNAAKRDGKISYEDLRIYLKEHKKSAPYWNFVADIHDNWIFPAVRGIRDGQFITRESFAQGLGFNGPNELRVEMLRFARALQMDDP